MRHRSFFIAKNREVIYIKKTISERGTKFMNKLHYVYKPSVAHQLLQMNYVIKDVKPQKQEDGSIDYTRCVFLFEDKEGIEYAIKALTKSKK